MTKTNTKSVKKRSLVDKKEVSDFIKSTREGALYIEEKDIFDKNSPFMKRISRLKRSKLIKDIRKQGFSYQKV